MNPSLFEQYMLNEKHFMGKLNAVLLAQIDTGKSSLESFFNCYFFHNNIFNRFISCSGFNFTNCKYYIHAANNFTKYSMMTIQPGCSNESDEKLTAVCIWTCICHRKNSGTIMF